MSLSKRAVLSVARNRPAFLMKQRAASSSHDHHDHHEDATVYPPESEHATAVAILQFLICCRSTGFVNPFWGKVLFFTLLTGAAIKYAPAPSEDVYLTRWIEMYRPSRELWYHLNAKHTAQSSQVSDNTLLIADAKPPPIHRFRYPQSVVIFLYKYCWSSFSPQVDLTGISLPQSGWRDCGYAKCSRKD